MDEITVEFDKIDANSSLEKKLRPTTILCWILGVSVPRPLNDKKIITIVLRVLHVGICSVIVAYGALDFFTFGTIYKSDTFKIMYYMNKAAGYVSSYYYVFHGIHHYAKWPKLVKKINSIDSKMRRFGLTRSDRSFKIFQYFCVFITILLGPVSLTCHALYYYFVRPEDIFASDLLLYYTITQSLIVHFSFDLIVFAIYSRFNTVNRAIRRLDDYGSNELVIIEIRRIRELHHGVCKLVTFVNGIYGVQLLLGSVNSFTMVVATLFRIYMGVVEHKYEFMMINNVIWITYAAQLTLTCYVCTKASTESSKTAQLVHDVVLNRLRRPPRSLYDVYIVDTMIRDCRDKDGSFGQEINDFSAQLQASEVAFTACHFFVMNNALLRSFISVTTTYLIILVQFYQPEVHDEDVTLSTLTPDAIGM